MAASLFHAPNSPVAGQPTPGEGPPLASSDGSLSAIPGQPVIGTQPTFGSFEGTPGTSSTSGAAPQSPQSHLMVDAPEWPEPQPLEVDLRPVAKLSSDHLPPTLVAFVGDISDRMQCPPDYVAAAALTALSSIIGTQLSIRPKRVDEWRVVPNLWGMIVGRPGAMKSPAVSEAIAPIKHLEVEAHVEFDKSSQIRQRNINVYKVRKRSWEDNLKKKLDKDPNAQIDMDPPLEPRMETPRRFIANDAKYEALGEIAAQNPRGVLVFRDELMSLLRLLDREENVAARGFYLSGWNGDEAYAFDRITRGQIQISPLCLSLLGTTQPARLTSYVNRIMKGSETDDGLLQRFGLLIWPDQNTHWSYVDRNCDANARERVEAMFKWLAKGDFSYFEPEYDRHGRAYLRYSEAAAAVFEEWLTNIERRLHSNDTHQIVESHLSKYRKLIPALSLIFHIADYVPGPVSESALRRAIAYGDYLETHANRAYSAGANMGVTIAELISKKLLSGSLANVFTARDIHQKDWAGLKDRELVQTGLDTLCEADWLQARIVATGGRSKIEYTINPQIFVRQNETR